MKKKSLKIFVYMFLIAAMLTGCGVSETISSAEAPEEYSRTVLAMDTVMNITSYGGSEELLDSVEGRIEELDSLLSTTDENSEIYEINQNGKASVSADTSELISLALDFCRKTKGALDITVYPVVREWGFTTGEFKIPDDKVLKELLSHVDYTQVSLDEETGEVSLGEGQMIDLGSVAKGYTGDEVIKLMKESGIKSALLDLGGNIQVIGSKPDGTDWHVAVQNPNGGDYLGIVSVSDKAVITSGGYERFFTGEDGKTYWHIIDPSTGRPAEKGLISVTVIGDKGVYCDALSTSLFIMGRDGAEEFWRKYHNFEMIMVDTDNEVTVTEGIADSFEMMYGNSYHLSVLER
jgi:thiamine biosynthesis lipoprotein